MTFGRTRIANRKHLTVPSPLVPMTRPTRRALVPGPTDRIVIIGAGLAGLSAALRLRAAGREVTVVEQADGVGGRARSEVLTSSHGGFLADTGATVLTMPHLVDAAIASVGACAEDYGWSPHRLSPAYHTHFASGRDLRVFSDEDAMAGEIRRFAEEKFGSGSSEVARLVDGYAKFRSWSRHMFTVAYSNFVAADFDSIVDVVRTPASASDLMRVVFSGGAGRLGPAVHRILGDPELERVFSFQALYAGAAPKRARAVYSVISYMDTAMGVYYPQEHIGQAAEAMANAARDAGVEILLGEQVTDIERDGSRISAIRTSAERRLAADAVVSTLELPALARLVGAERTAPQRRISRLTWSPSAVLIHGTVPAGQFDTVHHSISFGQEWDGVFEDITGTGAARGRASLMSDPSLLITRPAASAPSRVRTSPVGGMRYEPLSILAPAPNLQAAPVDWDSISEAYVQEILSTLESRGYPGLSDSLSIARVDTPATWENIHGYPAGSPFSLAHTALQTGPLRPRNFAAHGIENLILAGSSTTPGVGVPPALLSGALAARRITGGGVR